MVETLLDCDGRLFGQGRTAPCVLLGCDCPVYDADVSGFRGLSIGVAGHACKYVPRMHQSKVGMRELAARPLLIWIFERRRSREHLILTECTQYFHVPLLERILGHAFTLDLFTMGPEDFGVVGNSTLPIMRYGFAAGDRWHVRILPYIVIDQG